MGEIIKSNFEFSNPSLEALTFNIDENRDNLANITINHNVQYHIEPIDNNQAHVSIIYDLRPLNDVNVALSLSAKMGANFRWDNDTFSKEDINNLLSHNAPALLLGYLRPIVSIITSSARLTIDIPFMNFNQ